MRLQLASLIDRPSLTPHRVFLLGSLVLSASAYLLAGFLLDTLLWISYGHLSFAGIMGALSPFVALAGTGFAVLGLRRKKSVLSWVALAVSTVVAVVLVSGAALNASMGLPLRSGSDGMTGHGQGQIVELSSGLGVVVPHGWVGQLREVPPSERGRIGPVRILDLVPIGQAIVPGMLDITSADQGISLVVTADMTSANEIFELLVGESGVNRTTVSLPQGGFVTAFVQREPAGAQLMTKTTSVSGVIDLPGSSPMMIEARLADSELSDSAHDEDVILWLIDFIGLGAR